MHLFISILFYKHVQQIIECITLYIYKLFHSKNCKEVIKNSWINENMKIMNLQNNVFVYEIKICLLFYMIQIYFLMLNITVSYSICYSYYCRLQHQCLKKIKIQ